MFVDQGRAAGVAAKGHVKTCLDPIKERIEPELEYSLESRFKILTDFLPEKADWIAGFASGAGLGVKDALVLCLETSGLTPVPGCTVAFASGSAAEGRGSIVMKNGDIDSHWYMQMMEFSSATPAKGDFYSGPLSRYASKNRRFGFVGQRCFSYWAPHMGMNEAGVSVSLLAAPGREDRKNEGLLGGFDYNRIVLENAGSAEEAVHILGEAIQRFGFSDVSMMYVLGDKKEVWVLEASGFQWAARHYTDTVGARANDFRLENDFDKSSPGLVGHALEEGWIQDKREFNFREVYSGSGYLHHVAPPYPDIFSSTVRYERALDLIQSVRQKGCVEIEHMLNISRDQLDTWQLASGKRLEFNQRPWYSTKLFRDDYSGGEWLDQEPEGTVHEAPVFIRQICCDTVYEKTLGAAVFLSPAQTGSIRGAMLACTGVPTFSLFTPYFPVNDSVEPAFSGIEAARIFEEIDLHAFGKYEEFHPMAEHLFQPLEKEAIKTLRSMLTSGDKHEASQLSRKLAAKACQAARLLKARFWLRDARLRAWGRDRPFSGKIPYAYLTGGALEALTWDGILVASLPGFRVHDGGIEIREDIAEALSGSLHPGAHQRKVTKYVGLESMKYDNPLEWRFLPETEELYLFRDSSASPR